jgi:hypothetical protein
MSTFSFNYPNSPYYVPTSIFTDISCVKVNTPTGLIVFTISPSLPAPLTINSANGEITGLPTFLSISPTTTYTVDASYTIFPTHYNTSTTLQLGINFLPEFFYVGSPYVKQIDISVNAVSPPIKPEYAIPILPGMFYTDVSPVLLSDIELVLNTSTGEITGAPDALVSNQTYIIQANNAGVIYNASFVLSVENAPQPPDYPQSIYNLTQGVPVVIAPQTVQTNTTYAISGCGLPILEPTSSYTTGLPIGLAFDKATGAISGTPSMLTTYRQYIITATNLIGSVSTSLTLNVIKIFLAYRAPSDAFDGNYFLTDPTIAMRRKAEIFKYKKNNANISKKQQYSLAMKGNGQNAKRAWGSQNDTVTTPNTSGLPQQGNTIICNSPAILCSPTSSSDVPGPIMNLCYDPSVPLVGYFPLNRKKVNIGFKWPQQGWAPGDAGFPVGKSGSNQPP